MPRAMVVGVISARVGTVLMARKMTIAASKVVLVTSVDPVPPNSML